MSNYRHNAEATPVEMLPGVIRRTLTTTPGLMLCEIALDEGSTVPLHQHPHEQIGYVTQGQIEMTVAGEVRLCKAGDSYAIPGNTPHAARAVGGRTVVIDVFSPHREEYK